MDPTNPCGTVRVEEDENGEVWINANDLIISLHMGLDLFVKEQREEMREDPDFTEETFEAVVAVINRIGEEIIETIETFGKPFDEKEIPNN